jgi:hypothetical protein
MPWHNIAHAAQNIKHVEAPLEIPGDAIPANQHKHSHSDFTPDMEKLEASLEIPGDAIPVNQHKSPHAGFTPNNKQQSKIRSTSPEMPFP